MSSYSGMTTCDNVQRLGLKSFSAFEKGCNSSQATVASKFGNAMCNETGGQVMALLQLVVSIPSVPVHRCRAAVALFSRGLLLGVDLLCCRVAGHLYRAEPVQDVGVKLIGQLASNFHDLTSSTVVPQSSCHLLIGHGLAVAFSLAPAFSELLLVLGDEVECASAAVCPLD